MHDDSERRSRVEVALKVQDVQVKAWSKVVVRSETGPGCSVLPHICTHPDPYPLPIYPRTSSFARIHANGAHDAHSVAGSKPVGYLPRLGHTALLMRRLRSAAGAQDKGRRRGEAGGFV